MDKGSRKAKLPSIVSEDSLLPPTLRQRNQQVAYRSAEPVNDQPRKKKKRTINGFLRRVSAILDAHQTGSTTNPTAVAPVTSCSSSFSTVSSASSSSSSSCSLPEDDLHAQRFREQSKGKPKAIHTRQSIGDLLNANMQLLEAPLSRSNNNNNNNSNSCQSRSSDGSLDGPRRAGTARKGKVKARVEARRVEQLRAECSSLDESGDELEHARYRNSAQHRVASTEQQSLKKRSRASRTERYLKRMCNGANATDRDKSPRVLSQQQTAYPIGSARDFGATNPTGVCCENDITNDNFYARHTQVGVNPLVQQTLRYFSEFERNMPEPARVAVVGATPPKPPSRDHTSRILLNGSPLDKYQQMMRQLPGSPEQPRLPLGKNSEQPLTSTSPYPSPNSQRWNVKIEATCPSDSPSPISHRHQSRPFTESLNAAASDRGKVNACIRQTSPSFSTIAPNNHLENTNAGTSEMVDRATSKRSSKNLEEALCELEAIYNSLQLGDEELLDRAERRTMEEFLYKGFTSSPDSYDATDAACRRKTWADPSMDEPDRLKDDMAYRRMHPKERPTSIDGQSSLSSISYLMTSPIPCRRDSTPCVNTARKQPRRKEPDITLDDVVFRSMQYANNTLKVIEPQPPFGIPLGPITAAADSDYLHANPGESERARSPYIPCKEPDVVTDDLAFRNLRKDAQPTSSRQSSPSFLPSTPSPLPHGSRKMRSSLYGLMSKPTSPVLDTDNDDLSSMHTSSSMHDDYYPERREVEQQPRQRHFARRISDPEVTVPNWQKRTWQSLDPSSSSNSSGRHEHKERPSNRSCAFSEHEILVYKRLCQDLENLVQLTRSDDDPVPPRPSESVEPDSPEIPARVENVPLISTEIKDDADIELSSILDSLKSFGNDDPASPSAEDRTKTPEASESEKVTKDVCQSSAVPGLSEPQQAQPKEEKENEAGEVRERRRADGDKEPGPVDEEQEDKEKNYKVDDNVFLRSVQLAKLSGDWKESTPNSSVANRRMSLVNNGDSSSNAHWEGMNKCNHKYHSIPAKTSSLLMFRQYGSKRKSKNRKSMCTIS